MNWLREIKWLLVLSNFVAISCKPTKGALLIYTFATMETDAYIRFLRSMKTYNLKLRKTLGIGKDFSSYYLKIKLFRDELEQFKDRDDAIILFVDSYDAIFTAGRNEILKAFFALEANIVFSAETNCWPNPNVKDLYPEIERGYRFLNSGGFMGYASDLYEMLQVKVPADVTDDQYYYTLLFLTETLRRSLIMKLDTQASIFQNLYNAEDHISLVFYDNDTKLYNNYTHTMPSIIHGNGNSKQSLHRFSNYLAKSWTRTRRCLICDEERVNLTSLTEEKYPKVLMGIFLDLPTPFLLEKLNRISNLSYPKKNIFLFVCNKFEEQEKVVSSWIELQKDQLYRNVRYVPSSQYNGTISAMRLMAINLCLEISCDFFFSVDSQVYIENPNTLNHIVSFNRDLLAPVMTEPGTTRSTFYGDISDDFSYIESFDYNDIVTNKRRGIWNAAQVSNIYIMSKLYLGNPNLKLALTNEPDIPDIVISFLVRIEQGHSMFLYAANLHDYGHLTNSKFVPLDHLYNDLWQVATNPKDWEDKYLLPEYDAHLEDNFINEMICPDVFLFPLFTERYCQELIAVVESEAKWTKANTEQRQPAGKETLVPADIIPMGLFGYEIQWKYILQNYVESAVEKLYRGFHSKGESTANLVVRYTNKSLSFSNVNHESSIYKISVALNSYTNDYEGGGERFLRYNCTVKSVPIGWAMIHPGKLTHFPEKMSVNSGEKFEVNSFVN